MHFALDLGCPMQQKVRADSVVDAYFIEKRWLPRSNLRHRIRVVVVVVCYFSWGDEVPGSSPGHPVSRVVAQLVRARCRRLRLLHHGLTRGLE